MALVDEILRRRLVSCTKTLANQALCECLMDEQENGVDFDIYIAVTAKTKDELGYDLLTEERKALIDRAIKGRDACVRQTSSLTANISLQADRERYSAHFNAPAGGR
jgi:hypothetical protein